MLERADVKLLFTVTDFLDTNYEALLRAEPALPQLREIIDLRGAGVDASSSRATRGADSSRPRSPATTSARSSSRRARPAGPRARC